MLQAIPTYFVSCFNTPNGVVEEMQAVCSKFFWGSSIRRLLQMPDSLVGRILRAKYFPSSISWMQSWSIIPLLDEETFGIPC